MGVEASVLSLVVVILIKDVVLPLYRGNGNGNGNGKSNGRCPVEGTIAEIHTASRLHEREFQTRLDEFGEAVRALGTVSTQLSTQTALLERIARGLERLPQDGRVRHG